METRQFGRTDLHVSEVGFGAWGIGGPATAGNTAIGWGDVDDAVSIRALETALDRGINFFDTADFYGLGHSEKLIGDAFGNHDSVIIATKVGHRLDPEGGIFVDYSKDHILTACEASLKRLRRDAIDYYQLHSARVSHLESGECVEAMDLLQEQGKIRYWGVSLNTFNPFPEAEFVFEHNLGSGLQVVLNIINQRASSIIDRARREQFGIIARMPLQFGLLTGKFNRGSRFTETDHRHFRLKPPVLERALDDLSLVWPLKQKYGADETELSLSFVLSYPGVTTVIPGIKTPEQAISNTTGLVEIDEKDMATLRDLFKQRFNDLLEFMHQEESG